MIVNTLCKDERLCGERIISNLFENGQSFFQAPYKVFWINNSATGLYPCRFAVSVPKKRFKRAVKRNLIKRRTREVFRTNKQILNDVIADRQQVHLMVIYSFDNILPYFELNEAMKKILKRILLSLL